MRAYSIRCRTTFFEEPVAEPGHEFSNYAYVEPDGNGIFHRRPGPLSLIPNSAFPDPRLDSFHVGPWPQHCGKDIAYDPLLIYKESYAPGQPP